MKIFKSAGIFVFCIVLVTGIICSCSPEKRLQRLVSAHPELVRNDTLRLSDTVITAGTEIDTVIPVSLLNDTLIIEKEKLKLMFVEIHDSLFVEAVQSPDTVILTREIPVEKIVFAAQNEQSEFILIELFRKYRLYVIIALILILAVIVFKLNNKLRRNASY